MNNVTFDRARNSIGLSNFVEYYQDYLEYYQMNEQLRKANKMKLAQKLLSTNPKATSLQAQITRIGYTSYIFENGWEDQMLKVAIESGHPSISNELRVKAQMLLNDRRKI